MIRINLLKDTRPISRTGFDLPTDLIKKIGLGVGGLLVVLLLFTTVKSFVFGPKKSKDAGYIVRDAYDPSSHISKNVVEETVRDEKSHGDKIDKNGILKIPYEDMAFIEKVNFENHFAKAVINLLKENVSSGVDFRDISFSNYVDLKGKGRSRSDDEMDSVLIDNVFKRLRNNDVRFVPKPKTSIYKIKDSYNFKIESTFRPGLDSKAPFKIYKDDLPDYDDTEIIIKRIIDACQESGLFLRSGPGRNSADVKSGFRRLTYKMSCNGSYRQFAGFVNKMYIQQIPCSIRSAALKATGPGTLKINLEILITTKR